MGAHVPRVRIITGKGGVGKTTLATALALAASRAGQRVLLAEIDAGGQVAALLSTAPVGYTITEVLPRLFLVDVNATAAIDEYGVQVLRLEAVWRIAHDNRFVRRLLRLVPSLNQLVMLGKIWHHEQERVHGAYRFDLVIVDAPATGHALALLQAPGAVADVLPPSPVSRNARLLEQWLRDATRTRLHIVTTCEEMPLLEAENIAAQATQHLGLTLGTTFINKAPDPLAPELLLQLERGADSETQHAMVHVLSQRQERCRRDAMRLERLAPALRRDALPVPHFLEDAVSSSTLTQLAQHLANHAPLAAALAAPRPLEEEEL